MYMTAASVSTKLYVTGLTQKRMRLPQPLQREMFMNTTTARYPPVESVSDKEHRDKSRALYADTFPTLFVELPREQTRLFARIPPGVVPAHVTLQRQACEDWRPRALLSVDWVLERGGGLMSEEPLHPRLRAPRRAYPRLVLITYTHRGTSLIAPTPPPSGPRTLVSTYAGAARSCIRDVHVV